MQEALNAIKSGKFGFQQMAAVLLDLLNRGILTVFSCCKVCLTACECVEMCVCKRLLVNTLACNMHAYTHLCVRVCMRMRVCAH